MKSMTRFEEAVRTAVCSECLYPSGIGKCGCGEWKECPLNKFLPQALDAVMTGKSPSLVEYFRQFLADMKARQSEASAAERMPEDDLAWFERFLPIIAEAVDELKLQQLASVHRSSFH
jgi:hypothetical protein